MTRDRDGGSTFVMANPQNRVYSVVVKPGEYPKIQGVESR